MKYCLKFMLAVLFSLLFISGSAFAEMTAREYCDRGDDWYLSGEYALAIEDYSKAIELNPKYARAYNNRGLALNDKGEYDRAIQDYNIVIAMDSKDADAYYNRGLAWENKGEYDRAIQDCNKAIELDPKYVKAYISRGLLWEIKGEYDRTIQDYTKAIELDPYFVTAYYNRGITWYRKGEYDRAIQDYNKAIALNPEHAKTYHNLAWIFVICPDPEYRNGEKAIEMAKKAINIQKNAVWMDTLAAAYAEAGDFEMAVKTEEEAYATERQPEYKRLIEAYKKGWTYIEYEKRMKNK